MSSEEEGKVRAFFCRHDTIVNNADTATSNMYSPQSSDAVVSSAAALVRPCSVAPSWLKEGAENGALSSGEASADGSILKL